MLHIFCAKCIYFMSNIKSITVFTVTSAHTTEVDWKKHESCFKLPTVIYRIVSKICVNLCLVSFAFCSPRRSTLFCSLGERLCCLLINTRKTFFAVILCISSFEGACHPHAKDTCEQTGNKNLF